jgi:nucleoside-diphosphate-sugar epimerase
VCTEHEVVVLDKLTSAGRRENLAGLPVALVVGGIEDRALAREVMSGCDAVVNFAAESCGPLDRRPGRLRPRAPDGDLDPA